MVDITVPNTDSLNFGTTGDDTVTFEGVSVGANVGNGGNDTAILAAESLSALAAAGFDFGTTTADTWTNGAVTFNVDFGSITTSDGFTLEAGVALADDVNTFNVAGITDNSAIDGSYNADIAANSTSIDWDGNDLTPTALAAFNLVSFDGNTAAALATSPASDGAGSLTFNATGTQVNFTPNTSALAGDNNIGDVVTFTYDAVLADPADPTMTVTVPVTFSIVIGWTAGDDVVNGDFDSTNLNDTITDGAPIAGLNVLGGSDAGDDLISGGEGNDSLTAGAGSDTLRGGNGDDTLTDADATDATDVNVLGGGAGDDTISAAGSLSDNKLIGAGGDDSITGGAGSDAIQGGGGDDTISSGSVVGKSDTVRGGDGDDLITGGAGNDELRAGDGNDSVNGGAGNDLLFTSLGDSDTLTGGAGDDSFIIKAGTGHTVITDFDLVGSDEIDVTALGYTSLADVLEVSYELASGGSVIQIDADTSITLTGVVLTDLDATDFEFA